jgi:DNA repair protein RecO (recombination protein O)
MPATLVTDLAVTLSVSDYSETSQVASLFTRRNGRLSVIAKGAKRAKNRFGGPLDRLQCVEVVFSLSRRGGLGTLVELSLHEDTSGLGNDLKAFYAASTIAELVRLGTEELDPHPVLFDLLLRTLTGLSHPGDSDILLYRFGMGFLGELGLMPQLAACVSCGRSRAAGHKALFSPSAGGVLCRACRASGGHGLAVEGKALDALHFLAQAEDRDAGRVRLAAKTSADMRKLLAAYWTHTLGRPPRSLKWVK